MERIELIIYSKIIIGIALILKSDLDFARKFVQEPSGSRYLNFHVEFYLNQGLYLYLITFDREKCEFSYKTEGFEVKIENGLFDELIYYV